MPRVQDMAGTLSELGFEAFVFFVPEISFAASSKVLLDLHTLFPSPFPMVSPENHIYSEFPLAFLR